MRTMLMAAVSAMALMASPVFAQQGTSPSTGGSGGAPGGSAQSASPSGSAQSQETKSPSATQSQVSAQVPGVEMLGKRVKLSQGKKDIGEITDVVVVEGKVEDVVVEVRDLEDKPVLVSYSQLDADGDSYILSMTEAEIQAAPAHQGSKSGAAGQGQPSPGQSSPGQSRPGASQQEGQQKSQ